MVTVWCNFLIIRVVRVASSPLQQGSTQREHLVRGSGDLMQGIITN